MSTGFLLHGTAFHSLAPDRPEALEAALLEIGADGRIMSVQPHCATPPDRAIRLRPGQFLLPGLVDLHVHAPQWPQRGTALDVPLQDWLAQHTFPLESRYADTVFAAAIYAELVAALLAHGTTTAMYFATRHVPASLILAQTCLDQGQRALVGRVAMDHPETCPEYYRDASPQQALADTWDFIAGVRALPGNHAGRVLPAITPRFIPACTDALLGGLGALAAETGCHVQTHCSESDWAQAHVLARCGCTDTTALHRFGLLGRRSVLAHGNFMSDADLSLVAAQGAGVAHCALSNFYFAGAVFPLRAALQRQVHVGLGTDISGGPGISVLQAARDAIAASRALESGVDASMAPGIRGRAGARIGWREAFWLATAGGGQALDLPIGSFHPGQAFDALCIDTRAQDSDMCVLETDPPEIVLEKILHTAGRGNITQIWVDGRSLRPEAGA